MGQLFPLATIGSLALSAAMLTQAIRSKTCSFHLMYLSTEPKNLNGAKKLVDSRADIIRYNFNQV